MKILMTMQAIKTPREPLLILPPFDDVVYVGTAALGVVALGVVALGVVALSVVALGVVALGVVALGVVVVAFRGATYMRAIPMIGVSEPSEFNIGAYSEVL